jgi:predicted Zn-dependent protease
MYKQEGLLHMGRHSCEGGNPEKMMMNWIPAFAGMTPKYSTALNCICLLLCTLLTACTRPTTLPVSVTPQEIAAEEHYQKEYVKNTYASGYVHGVGNSASPQTRLQAVAPRVIQAAVKLCGEQKWRADARDCGYDISLTRPKANEGDTVNAYADGKSIFITSAMVKFTRNDDELAFILAHETAHNVMEHISGLQQNALVGMLAGMAADIAMASAGGGNGSTFTQLGGSLAGQAYSPEFEAEADYIGLYLAARAGYDISGAPDMWRRMSLDNPDSIYLTSTHPSNAARYVSMRKTVAEIQGKQARGLPLVPEFKKAAPPSTNMQSFSSKKRR